MNCPFCGNANPDEAVFCGQCGKKLQKRNSFEDRRETDTISDDTNMSISKIPIAIFSVIVVVTIIIFIIFLFVSKKSPPSKKSSTIADSTESSTEEYENTEYEIESSEDSFDDSTESTESYDTAIVDYPEDAVYNEENGHHYVLKDVSLYWDEAYEECVRQNGHLATITSEQEQKFIRKLIEEEGEKYHYWLGGSDADSEGDWRWVTGEDWDYTNWEVNQPNNDLNYDEVHGQDYLEIQTTFGNNGADEYMKWTDMAIDGENPIWAEAPEYCSTPYYGYICEWDE